MSTNLILAIFLVLMVITFFSCMIAGDVFASKIAFNATAMDCDSFADTPTQQAQTTQQAQSTRPAIVLHKNNACIGLDTTQIGFVKFRMAIYWITFILLTGLLGYGGITLVTKGVIGLIFLFIFVVMWIFLLVGGIFLSQFAFQAIQKTCNGSPSYCYNLNNAEIIFARMSAIFNFIITFIITGGIVFGLYKMN